MYSSTTVVSAFLSFLIDYQSLMAIHFVTIIIVAAVASERCVSLRAEVGAISLVGSRTVAAALQIKS